MHHLMRHGILLMPPIPELIRAQQNAVVDMKAAALLARAHPTDDVLRIDIAAQLCDLVFQEGHDGAVFEEVVPIVFASFAVCVFVYGVLLGEVVVLEGSVPVPGHAAKEDGEGVAPVVKVAVKLRGCGLCGFGGKRAIGGLFCGIPHCWGC